MKTRIVVFSQTDRHWGGSFQYAKALTTALVGLDPDHFEIRVWHADDPEWNDLCFKLAFPQYSLESVKDINAWEPDLIISPQMFSMHYLKGAKHIGVIHDLMHHYEYRFPEAADGAVQRERFFNFALKRCDVVLVDSRLGIRHVKECYPQARDDQLQVLPYTAFAEITECTPEQPQFSVPEKFFFYPAKFWKHKNHLGLAQAIDQIREEFPDLVIVAPGSRNANGYFPLMDFLREKELVANFIMPGYVSAPELAWLYQHARALIMPTFFGPTNIPPLEAMALGCPVAVSDVYAMRKECGDAALYFIPKNAHNIAAIMRRLWTDDQLCANLRQKGLARAKQYDISRFNKQVLRIVKNLCTA